MPTQIDNIYSTCTYVQHGVMLDPNQSGTCPTVIVVLSYIYICGDRTCRYREKKTLKLKANTKRCNAVRPYGDEPSTAMMLRYLPPSIICFLVCLPIIYICICIYASWVERQRFKGGAFISGNLYIYTKQSKPGY